jgi:cellulose/xylan binding protein with CBM9 domain
MESAPNHRAARGALCAVALRSGVAAGALLLLTATALAAEAPQPPEPPARDFNTYVPSARATRIETSEAPIIDGDVSDAVWARAELIDEFYQLEPDTGQPVSERTELRILYDSENLYISVYAYDRNPELIRATTKNRDGSFAVDDTVRLTLDPQNTRRNGYLFVMNALGGRIDDLIQNNTDFIREWNSIWIGRSRIVDDGWTVEMAIPFRNFSFDPSQSEWVIDFSREIRRKNERARWSSISAAERPADISRAGTLTGITGTNQGLGLDIQVYGALRYRFDWQEPQHETSSFRASGNAFYRITPQLTGTLTLNPDFSNSPLDLLQINTTRFNLFQPETRDFFLQDVATFEFGGRGFTTGGRGAGDYPYPPENGSPFFSRNMGLANGLPVSLIAGTKLSGEYAGFGVGALSVVTNGTGDTQHSQVLSVARITRPIGESKLGIIYTNGDPTGRSKNAVTGADFQFRDSDFLPGKILQSDVYYQRSFSDTKGDDDTFGVAVNYPNEPWSLDTRFKQVGTNFFPALGFVNRLGIRQFDGILQHRARNFAGWRWLDFATSWYFVTDLSNRLESRENGLWAGINSRAGDQYYVKAFDSFEAVPATFKVAGKVPVPPGRYHWTNGNLSLQSSNARPLTASLDILCCSFYDGNYFRVDLRTDIRVGALFQLVPRYTYTYINLPGGLLNIHAIAANFIVSFTPDMQLVNQVQFDNVSERFTLSMRYRWEYQPGQELFVSVGQAAQIPGEEFVASSTQVIVRLGHTFRF